MLKNRIKYGKNIDSRKITVNGNSYYIEVAKFNSYQESISSTYKVVDDVGEGEEILENKCDLYDWTSTIMRFNNSTVVIRNIRPEHKIILAESLVPCSIETIEKDSPILSYIRGLKR